MENDGISAKNTLNELTGAEWLYFTKSILTTTYPSAYGHQLRKAHGANKPPQLMSQLIEFFTKPGGRVLDPFAGVGGTLIGASICKKPRHALGFEINQKWVDIYQQIIAESNGTLLPQQMLCGDCLSLMEMQESASFDFIATDPPYNIHLEQTMSNGRYAEATSTGAQTMTCVLRSLPTWRIWRTMMHISMRWNVSLPPVIAC